MSARTHGLDLGSRGTPLRDETKRQFQGHFGVDLSPVRLHDGSAANQLARSLDADAVTHGNDIAFRQPAMYQRGDLGTHLLAHELTHVVQGGERIYRSVSGAVKAVKEGDTVKARKQANEYFDKGTAKTAAAVATAATAVLPPLTMMSPVIYGVGMAAAEVLDRPSEGRELEEKLDKLLATATDRDVQASARYILRRLNLTRQNSVPKNMRIDGIPPRVYVPGGMSAANRTMRGSTQLSKNRGGLEPQFASAAGKAPTLEQNVDAFYHESFERRVNAAAKSVPDPARWIGLSAPEVMVQTSQVLDPDNTTATPEQRAEARAVRTAAGRASFDAISQTLNVEESNLTSAETKQILDWRNDPDNAEKLEELEAKKHPDQRIANAAGVRVNRYTEFDGAFKCNIYMTDFSNLHPSQPFLPKVWWTKPDKIKEYFAVDELSTKSDDVKYMSKSPRGINEWLRTVGEDYGWFGVGGKDHEAQERKAQDLANAGEFVVFTAKTVNGGALEGHSGVVAPEDRNNKFDSSKTVGERFVRSQAGALGISRGHGGTNIFNRAHFDGGFWVYKRGKDKTADKVPFVFER